MWQVDARMQLIILAEHFTARERQIGYSGFRVFSEDHTCRDVRTGVFATIDDVRKITDFSLLQIVGC